MAASQRLRVSDVAAVYRLVEECRELGADPHVWQHHMLHQLASLTGCWTSGNCQVQTTLRGMQIDWTTLLEIGRTDSERRRAAEFLTSGECPPDDFCIALSRRFVKGHDVELTCVLRDVVDDRAWRRSDSAAAYRELGVGDQLMSLARIPGTERTLCLGCSRAVGDRSIATRQAQTVEMFMRIVRPHLGRSLALAGEPGLSGLSPRRRQVLAGLLEGRAEKEIAHMLGLSRPTVHEYVTDLYRYFGVGSRAELLALFLRRSNGPAREWLARFPG